MFAPGPPPPPPPPQVRPGGPPPPPPGARPPPQGFQMQLPFRQQSTMVQDLTPQKIMDDKACLKKLTTYTAWTLRKCTPLDHKAKPTWARAELTEERLPQKEIEKEIKRLDAKRETVSVKRAALQPYQHNQITTLLDNLGTQEQDRAFEWSLIQIDSERKPKTLKNGKKEPGKGETLTMTAYVKRAPREDINPVMLYQNNERMKAERMRPPQQNPPPPPPPPQNLPPLPGPPPPRPGPPPQHMEPRNQHPIINMSRENSRRRSSVPRPSSKGNRRDKKYHDQHDDSTISSATYDSDTASTSSSGSSSATSASSRSRGQRRHSKGPYRSHSRHEPKRNTLNSPVGSPRSSDRHFNEADAYGGIPSQRPHAPEVPRQINTVDPIIAAYQAGKEDATAERYGVNERIPSQPSIQPVVIERIIEPRPQNVISYSRPTAERRYSEQTGYRYSVGREPRYIDERYIDDLRRRDEYDERLRDAEDYMDRESLERVPVERVPVGRVPVGRVPVGRVPVGRVPLGRVPLGRVPLDDVPLGRVPLDRGAYRVGAEPRMEYERKLFDSRGDYDVPREFIPRRPSSPGRVFNDSNPFSPTAPPPLRRVYPTSSSHDGW